MEKLEEVDHLEVLQNYKYLNQYKNIYSFHLDYSVYTHTLSKVGSKKSSECSKKILDRYALLSKYTPHIKPQAFLAQSIQKAQLIPHTQLWCLIDETPHHYRNIQQCCCHLLHDTVHCLAIYEHDRSS